ncbi:MAG: thermonuclease family protein [Verrucomicrobiota bacterium]
MKPEYSTERIGSYYRLTGVCPLEHRYNDGDSFLVRHGEDEFELRLYYVDTPEKYLSDEHAKQRERVAEQADYFGLSLDQTIALGQVAKTYVERLFQEQGSFTVYTAWEQVYDGDRYHGFVEIDDPQKPSEKIYLTELLVREGLGRIHTRGEETPKGQSWRAYKEQLYSLERRAKEARRGAWMF